MKDQTTIVSVATVEIVELCSHKNSSVQLDTAFCLIVFLGLFRKGGVRSAECGVRSAECGVRSQKKILKNKKKKLKKNRNKRI